MKESEGPIEDVFAEAERLSGALGRINGVVLSPNDCEHHAKVMARLVSEFRNLSSHGWAGPEEHQKLKNIVDSFCDVHNDEAPLVCPECEAVKMMEERDVWKEKAEAAKSLVRQYQLVIDREDMAIVEDVQRIESQRDAYKKDAERLAGELYHFVHAIEAAQDPATIPGDARYWRIKDALNLHDSLQSPKPSPDDPMTYDPKPGWRS